MGQLICDFAICILLLYFHIFTLEVSMKYCIIYARYNTYIHDTTTSGDGSLMRLFLYL